MQSCEGNLVTVEGNLVTVATIDWPAQAKLLSAAKAATEMCSTR